MVLEVIRDASPSTHVTVKTSGEEAIEFLLQSLNYDPLLPELILMDMNLPGISGLQILEELKKSLRLKEISIIALTGSMNPDEMAVVTAYSGCRYLVKPSDMEGYSALMRELLAISRYD